jgi:hypothetical protein
MRRLARLPWPIVLGLVAGILAGGYLVRERARTVTIPDPTPNIPVVEAPPAASVPAPTITIPTAYTISGVPFTPQAPFANWDELHNEACEEASVLMVRRYFDGERGGRIDPADADREIYEIVEWQKQHLGKYLDTDAEETMRILTEKYGRKARLSTAVTVNSIKKEIAAGHLVIVPAAGQLLPNPYFRTPGPPYHMLVIVGYNATEFITNDPGTRRGEGFRYKHTDLLNAVHDWTGRKATITQGRKVMIVVEG